ncbi:hypothetical protein NE237_020728 [Protea cynaroides]|uniref:Uncharacterized protein n=1 Tax=Protea cynaroides TaxID=273540 RepID=A0A9Q0H9S2_9MAGN|nr:hypothetical protein NE237_020728 [Protea cynaroides]
MLLNGGCSPHAPCETESLAPANFFLQSFGPILDQKPSPNIQISSYFLLLSNYLRFSLKLYDLLPFWKLFHFELLIELVSSPGINFAPLGWMFLCHAADSEPLKGDFLLKPTFEEAGNLI